MARIQWQSAVYARSGSIQFLRSVNAGSLVTVI